SQGYNSDDTFYPPFINNDMEESFDKDPIAIGYLLELWQNLSQMYIREILYPIVTSGVQESTDTKHLATGVFQATTTIEEEYYLVWEQMLPLQVYTPSRIQQDMKIQQE
ncbi:10985_t:CDS:2, partial [Racocetra fulgida]